MANLKLIVNFRNGAQNNYKGQLIKEVDVNNCEDVYSLINDAIRYDNNGDVKSVSVQHYSDNNKFIGCIKFWATNYHCEEDVDISDFDYE